MLDCEEKRRNTVKPVFSTSLVPRQVLLSSSSSSRSSMTLPKMENGKNTTTSITSQDRVTLLQSICQFLELNGFNKSLKKFRGEADVEKDSWKNCSLNLEEMFQDHLRKCNATDETNERAKDNGVKEKPKKKKQKDVLVPFDKDLSEQPEGANLSIPSEPMKKLKEKKKRKDKDESQILDRDLSENNDATGETTGKNDNVSAIEKKVKSKRKKMKDEVSVSNDEVDEEAKCSKKRKRSSYEDITTPSVKETTAGDSKCKKMDASGNSERDDQPPTTNGFLDKDGVEKAQKQEKTNERNGSLEPTSAKAFQRVKADEVVIDERLRDNSYWAKDGAESGYGAKAQEVLGQVRGRDFRHEKTKKKRGSYRGGQIDLQSHSIKFNYDDDDE